MIIIFCKCVFDVLWVNSYFGKNMVIIFVRNNVLVKSVNIIYGVMNVFRFGLYVLNDYVMFVWINFICIYVCMKCNSVIC